MGYLARGHPFPRGKGLENFFDRLVALVEQPLGCWSGYHTCDLGWCRLTRPREPMLYKGRLIGLGSTDIFVPGDEVVYAAPSLILHYIRDHKYLPPPCFVQAVLKCPEPRSSEYAAAIKRIAPEMTRFLGIPLQNSSETGIADAEAEKFDQVLCSLKEAESRLPRRRGHLSRLFRRSER